jgi:hypothetical protein
LYGKAQKDKTINWSLPQKGQTVITVNAHSKPSGNNYFEEYHISPQSLKILHISVITVSPATGMITKAPFAIQLKTRKKEFINQVVLDKGTFDINLPLATTDTIAVIFIVPPPASNDIHFYLNYTISDTAELAYTNKKSQEVFEKILELASTGYINLYNNSNGSFAKIIYPDGLFAPGTAERSHFKNDVTQYIGEKLNRASADKDMADWNKKIKIWLNDYNVTDVKKNTKGDVKLNTDEEETIYTKTNAQGVRLFVVTVFKKTMGEGTEEDPMSYTTGVNISN